MAGNPTLRVLAETEVPEPNQAGNEPEGKSDFATSVLLTALTALSKRTVVALSNLFSLLTIASAFTLWYIVLPNPSIPQLVGLGLYGLFILAMHFAIRVKR